MAITNKGLNKAKKAKNDEFYTKYEDIAEEIKHYTQHFDNKIIYCNCDDYNKSNFFKYFHDNFHNFKLKKLITTSYNKDGKGLYSIYDGNTLTTGELNGNGSFDSEESLEYLKESDIVITNPPFSLFRKYMEIIFNSNKYFITLGNVNCLTYKEIFPKIKEHKVWFGYKYNGSYNYILPNGEECVVGGPVWLTNLENNKNESMDLTEQYVEGKYERYDNYDAINVNKTKDIPFDYDGVIGVPISAIKYLCSDGLLHFDVPEIEKEYYYKIVWTTDRGGDKMIEHLKKPHNRYDAPCINGKGLYKRLFIQKYKIVGWSTHNDLNMDGGYWIGGNNDATIDGKRVYRRILIKREDS